MISEFFCEEITGSLPQTSENDKAKTHGGTLKSIPVMLNFLAHPGVSFIAGTTNAVNTATPTRILAIGFINESPWSNKFHPDLDDGMYPLEELRKLEVEANERSKYGHGKEGYLHEGDGRLYMIIQQMEDGHLCNMGKKIEELEGKLRNQLDQVYHFYSLSSSVYLLL
ncbi:probable F-actin-capping protein subunit beta [Tanacetum coccineum]